MRSKTVYLRMDGDVVDLSSLTNEEWAHFERCLSAYGEDMHWPTFSGLVRTYENPLLRPTGGMITKAVWYHPLFRAIRDMEDRLGVKQGFFGGTMDPDSPMFGDDWVATSEAAERKGVTVPGLHEAIKRGDVVARPIKPGGSHLEVNVASLNHWEVNKLRQDSGGGKSTKN